MVVDDAFGDVVVVVRKADDDDVVVPCWLDFAVVAAAQLISCLGLAVEWLPCRDLSSHSCIRLFLSPL